MLLFQFILISDNRKPLGSSIAYLQNCRAKVDVNPSAAALIIKALKEGQEYQAQWYHYHGQYLELCQNYEAKIYVKTSCWFS